MSTKDNYQLLLEKLDQFIRKYYVNQLIRGLLYTIGLVIALYLLFTISEYFFYFNTSIRKTLFYGLVGTTIVSLSYWVITPIIKYFNLGNTISHEQAATIIGDHFVDVKDKLLNVLQLKKQVVDSSSNKALIEASIQQKTEKITIVPFKAAIDLAKNKKYLKYALPPFLIFLALLFGAPTMLTESTNRLINNDKEFKKAAPFDFTIKNKDLTALQFEDYTLEVEVKGKILPNEVFVDIDNFQYKMEKTSNETYSYTFRNVQKDTKFNLTSGTVTSLTNELVVLKKPNLQHFIVYLDYPNYTGREDETLQSIGDLILPEGTNIKWKFETANTNRISAKFEGEKEINAESLGENLFLLRKSARRDQTYSIQLFNNNVTKPDSTHYAISISKDQYPSISSDKIVDSTDKTVQLIVGNIADDYGFTKLTFNHSIKTKSGQEVKKAAIPLTLPGGKSGNFEYVVDSKKLGLNPGDQLSFYFEIFDNDGVNGAKSTKTSVMTLSKASFEEFKAEENKNEEELKSKLNQAVSDIDKLQENFRKMKEKLLQKKELNWQDKKELEQLVKQQEELQKKLEKAKENLAENMKNQEEFEQPSEEIKEKQEELKKMMEEAIDPEKQELLDKIKELMQDLEKEDAIKMMDKFEMDNENLDKDLNRLKELFKQLEVEKEAQEQIQKLKEMAERQDKLADETADQKKSAEELKKEQEQLKKELDEVKKAVDALEKKNEELKPPKDLGKENKEQLEDIKNEMEQSKQELSKKENSKASKSQKKAAQKMKKMAESMESSMDGGDNEQAAEDIKTLRQLLENLVTVSFDQEQLIAELALNPAGTPRYTGLLQKQYKLKDDFKIIEDTLTALSTRQAKIESFVNDKVTEIKFNMAQSIDELEARQNPKATQNQRRTMQNLNDLALMLSESMKNMQESQSSGKPGSGSCNKPGGKGQKPGSSKMPMDKITEGQQGLDEMLKKMGSKKGKEGDPKSGKEGKDGNPSAKEFAQAAAKQAALRKALSDLQKEKQEQGKGAGLFNDILNSMDKMETDLVNKRFNAEMMKRQQDIVTRLLEAEKAERKQDEDNKRKSETAQDTKTTLPPSLQEYLKKRNAEVDTYKTVAPALKPQYKLIVDEYNKSLRSTK